MAEINTKFMAKVTPYDVGGAPGEVAFKLGNGQSIVARMEDFPPEIVTRLAYHGLSQKVGDTTSGFAKERKFGDAYAALGDAVQNLKDGRWSGATGGGVGDLAEAIAGLKKLPVETVREAIGKMSEDKLKEIMARADVKAAVAKIKADRAAAAAKAAAKSLGSFEL